jgi:hypothetical protein
MHMSILLKILLGVLVGTLLLECKCRILNIASVWWNVERLWQNQKLK